MKETMDLKRTGAMPKFVTHFWDISEKKLLARGHDTSAKGLCKRFAKHYCEGRVEHVQSGDYRIFHSTAELLSFYDKHRYK